MAFSRCDKFEGPPWLFLHKAALHTFLFSSFFIPEKSWASRRMDPFHANVELTRRLSLYFRILSHCNSLEISQWYPIAQKGRKIAIKTNEEHVIFFHELITSSLIKSHKRKFCTFYVTAIIIATVINTSI